MRRLRGSIFLFACTLLTLNLSSRADDAATPADPIRVRLDNAKAVDVKSRKQAADTVREACDDAIRAANASKLPEGAALLKGQEDAFTATGSLPTAPAVKQAVDNYREATLQADANLEKAYARAVRHYSAQGDGNKALAVELEKSGRLQKQIVAAPSTQPLASATASSQALAQAKTQYRTDVDDAMKALIAKVDARLNTAADAGDLQTAQALKAAEDALKAGAALPASLTDPAVIAAAANYRRAIQASNVRMARAFTSAVRNLTRARDLNRAQAVQTEFVATGLASIDTGSDAQGGAAPTDTTYVLGRNLPEFFTTSDRWDMHPHGGIFLPRRTFIRSKNGDFLNRDFVCDLWFTTESTGTFITLGVGEGRGRPLDGVPINCLALCINSPDIDNGSVGLLRADGQIDTMGQLNTAGDFVARIERSGKTLSLSIGDEDADGTFNPKIATILSDPNVFAPFMTTHNAHIFFGGGRFSRVRYINGKPPAVIPDTVTLLSP